MTKAILPSATRRRRPRAAGRTRPYTPLLHPSPPITRPARSVRSVRPYAVRAFNRQRMGVEPITAHCADGRLLVGAGVER